MARKNKGRFMWVATIAMVLGAPAWAAKFSNQFTEFELPPQWQCSLEGAEWVCQSTDDSKKRDAIIVLAAKLKGDQDSVDQYLSYLKAVKTYTSVNGKPMKSEVRYAKTVNLQGQPWVDALHLESEIPGFYTRYLATTKDDIGVLVTYSINKAKYQMYQKDFDAMVNTLKVFRKAGGINVAPANTNLMNTQVPVTVADGTVFPGTAIQGGSDAPKPVAKKEDNTMLYLIVGGAIAFFIWKKKKG